MLLYLEPVMVRLLDLVCTADIEVREMVLPAITAVADVVDEAFLPYYPKTIEIVRAFMSQVLFASRKFNLDYKVNHFCLGKHRVSESPMSSNRMCRHFGRFCWQRGVPGIVIIKHFGLWLRELTTNTLGL